jgi:hypothetical protein
MDTNWDYLIWGILPVLIALVYIWYKNEKFRKF